MDKNRFKYRKKNNMTACNHFGGKIKSVWYIEPKYNYRAKIGKALEDKNYKYIRMLIKKGKLTIKE